MRQTPEAANFWFLWIHFFDLLRPDILIRTYVISHDVPNRHTHEYRLHYIIDYRKCMYSAFLLVRRLRHCSSSYTQHPISSFARWMHVWILLVLHICMDIALESGYFHRGHASNLAAFFSSWDKKRLTDFWEKRLRNVFFFAVLFVFWSVSPDDRMIFFFFRPLSSRGFRLV